MNRRMRKARKARAFHAARTRQASRLVQAAMARMGDAMAGVITGQDSLAAGFQRATQAMGDFVAEHVVRQAVRRGLDSFGSVFAREPGGGGLVHVGDVTAPIQLSLADREAVWLRATEGLPPPCAYPPGAVDCRCTVTRTTKTDSQGKLVQVDVPGPLCDYCAAAYVWTGQRCGTCHQAIVDDPLTGTTCACTVGP